VTDDAWSFAVSAPRLTTQGLAKHWKRWMSILASGWMNPRILVELACRPAELHEL
jgi:hypothetical protein